MGSAIHKALDMIQARKAPYRAHGVTYYRPWVFMITDGEPQGESDNIVTESHSVSEMTKPTSVSSLLWVWRTRTWDA